MRKQFLKAILSDYTFHLDCLEIYFSLYPNRVFYDPEKSFRGAKLCMVKKRTEAKQINYFANQRIITPYALPLFKVGFIQIKYIFFHKNMFHIILV